MRGSDADPDCIIEKNDGCKNNPDNLSTTKVSENIPSGFSMSTISLFRSIGNKCDVCRGKDCMKKFCEFLREHTIKTINLKKTKLLTKEQEELYENAKVCYICKEKFENKYLKDKKKLEIILIMLEKIEELCITYVIYNIVCLKKLL